MDPSGSQLLPPRRQNQLTIYSQRKERSAHKNGNSHVPQLVAAQDTNSDSHPEEAGGTCRISVREERSNRESIASVS